ncbi:MAG: hypothetical protein K6F28_09940 [Lachnospiraceae bacterium]|nr:hypothetical protein [Lachnospiraceae bacterium]
MALSRKMLKAMGIEDEKIEQIIEAHTETSDALKEERDNYKAEAEKVPALKKELDELKDAAEKNDGKNPWKVKYEALKEEYDTYKADVDQKATKAVKEEAYRALLKGAGVNEKHIAKVLKVSDDIVNGIELDKDGKVKDADKLTESIKEEWGDFIITNQGTQGANTSTPPANTGGKKTKDEILAIKDTTERQKAMAENHELFGIV